MSSSYTSRVSVRALVVFRVLAFGLGLVLGFTSGLRLLLWLWFELDVVTSIEVYNELGLGLGLRLRLGLGGCRVRVRCGVPYIVD